MKKLFILGILAFGFTQTTTAQKKGDVEFGLNIGYNSSTVSASDSYSESDAGNGFNAGLAADYYFSDRWSIKAKLIYDQKGWNNGYFENTMGYYKADYNLNYLTIPVMANWHFGQKRNWYLNFGPYAGFLLSAKESSHDTDVKDGFSNSDFGLALGIGVKIPISNKLKLSFEYEGQGGFNDIFKENDYSAVRNTRSSFNIGINFLLK